MRVSRTGIILFGIVLLGLALRMTDAIHFWNNGDVILEKLDAIEHLRRATILYHSFPWIPAKDYYTAGISGREKSLEQIGWNLIRFGAGTFVRGY